MKARKQRKKAQRKESQPVNGCRNVGYGSNGGYISNEFRDKEASYQICPEMKTNDNSMSRCNNYTINRGFCQDLKKRESNGSTTFIRKLYTNYLL